MTGVTEGRKREKVRKVITLITWSDLFSHATDRPSHASPSPKTTLGDKDAVVEVGKQGLQVTLELFYLLS